MSFHEDLRGLDLHAPSNERVQNNTGSTIPKLRVVTLDGIGTPHPQVRLANPNMFVNFGITTAEMIDGADELVTTIGFMWAVDTSAWPVGTRLYSDINGVLSTGLLGAPVALVIHQDAQCGILYVTAFGDLFVNKAKREIITLTQDMIENKSLELSEAPSTELSVQLVPQGGPPQFPGEDFSVAGNIITWDSLGLDGVLDIGDKLLIYYRV